MIGETIVFRSVGDDFGLLRRCAAELNFRREIGIHQCQAPMQRRANLL